LGIVSLWPATKTTETRSLAGRPHDGAVRLAAKTALKRPAVRFDDEQIRAMSQGFAEYAERSSLAIVACAILPDHVHLVLKRHRLDPEQLAIQLKGAATRQLSRAEIHPFAAEGRPAKCFARGEWTVYLDSEEDVRRAIRYVDDNPVKEGRARQRFDFVTPYC
jgi:REP element-mobilizing transposase RayT